MPTNNPDTVWQAVIAVSVFVILPLLVFVFAMFLKDFLGELKVIKCEIERTDGDERKYWVRRKRRLWLSLIPFVRYK